MDFYGGVGDLERGILRHTSPAFVEDPVRILRVARFAARYARLGFHVADETLNFMRDMVANGEADALVPERVWQELVRALGEDTPVEFFEVLRSCGALAVIFPEIERLFGIPQPTEHHPEIDSGVHTMMVLAQAARLSANPEVRFAALTHDLGKGTTPQEAWPRHIDHERRGVELVEALCERLKSPRSYRDLARHVARYHLRCHRANELRPSTLLKTLEALDAFRKPDRFAKFLLACEADYRGRAGNDNAPYPQADLLRSALAAADSIDPKPLIIRGINGESLAREIRKQRLNAIKRLTQH
jgi:tRNA nucleotidyltransferase (CCA-adding enzyme)